MISPNKVHPLIWPTLTPKGTAKTDLLTPHNHALRKVGEALQAVRETAPHVRDYKHEGPHSYADAQEQYRRHIKHLVLVQAELELILSHIVRQDPK